MIQSFSFAQRLQHTQFGLKGGGFKFARIKAAKLAALKKWPDRQLLDFGIGEPQDPPDPRVIEALAQAARKPHVHGYADLGSLEFRQAAARHMQRRFAVDLSPETQILHSMGSKAALMQIPATLINPGDVTLMTSPGYPVFSIHTKYYGGRVHELPLKENHAFLPDFSNLPATLLNKTKALVLNYPNNPTGAMAPKSFFEEAIAFCQKWGIVLIHDCAYIDLDWGGQKAHSIFECAGAQECALELHSLSKAFSMTGWRLGWVCGNPELVKAYGHAKDQCDSGQFLAIQEAGICALETQEITQVARQRYARRMQRLIEVLTPSGFPIQAPQAGFFLYVRSPKQVQRGDHSWSFDCAEAFSQWLIPELGLVVVPWDDQGPFIRFSVTFKGLTPEDEAPVWKLLEERLSSCTFTF